MFLPPMLHLRPDLFGDNTVSYSVGAADSFPGLKRSGRKADISRPSNVEVNNAWSFNHNPLYVVVIDKPLEHECHLNNIHNIIFYSIENTSGFHAEDQSDNASNETVVYFEKSNITINTNFM